MNTLVNKSLVSISVVFLLAFVTTFLASSVFAPISTTNADTLIFNVDGTDYYTSISSADNIELDLMATPSGAVGIASDTVTTITNNPDGYQLYFSVGQTADYDTTHPGNALYQDGNSTSSYFISPTTGTISDPDKLGQNTWGFALVGGDNKSSTVPDTFSNFDSAYVDSNGNSSTGETDKTLNSNSKFAAVPLKKDAVMIESRDTATPETGDKLSVYYGVNGTMALPSGSYIGTVNYFVLSDSSAYNVDGISLVPATATSAGGQEITIATSLHTNYKFATSDIVVTLTDKNDETNTGICEVTETDTEIGNLIVKCTSPALDAGEYNINVSVPLYSKSWDRDFTITAAPSADFWTITYMQDMTPEICGELYTPSNAIGSNLSIIILGSDTTATITGAKEVLTVNNMKEYQAIVTGKDQAYVAQRTLIDERDNKSYVIRKLADGNCWMTQNLVLQLEANQTYKDYGSYTDGTTFDLSTGARCSNNGACIMNGNTVTGHYSWYAATAGTGTSSTDAGISVSGSICPANWVLPENYTNAPNKSYGSITMAYLGFADNRSRNDVATLEALPLSFSRAGTYDTAGAARVGTHGYYWSATASSTSAAYYLYYYTSGTYPQNALSKYGGFSVRCVAR